MAKENSRLMANQREIMFSSALRAAGAHTSTIITNHCSKGGIFYLDITAEGGTATLDVKLQTIDPIGGDWVDLANNVAGTGAYAFAQASGVTTGPTILTIYPGLTASANAVCTGILPMQFRAHATVAGSSTPTFTFSLGVDLID